MNRALRINLSQETLKKHLHYDPATGIFTRLNKINFSKGKVGDVAGTFAQGYINIKINKIAYRAHRLAWLYMHGCWPTYQIDHINGIPSDNRIENLRDISQALNTQNLRWPRKHNKSSGLLGVTYYPKIGKYRSEICINKKRIPLGYFNTAEAAANAYIAKKREVHPACTI